MIVQAIAMVLLAYSWAFSYTLRSYRCDTTRCRWVNRASQAQMTTNRALPWVSGLKCRADAQALHRG